MTLAFPKPTARPKQNCPRCEKPFRSPNALYRHALKCRAGAPNRFGSTAKKSRQADYLFDSGLERDLYNLLKLRERVGELRDIKVKPNVRITEAGILVIPDFSAVETKTDQLRYHEAKGCVTEVWLLKMRLWRCYGPAPIDVYVASSRGPAFWKTIGAVLLSDA